MIEQFDETAVKNSAIIMHSCSYNSVPWELSVYMMNQQIRSLKPDEQLSTVEILDNGSFEMSGGTINTISHIIDNPPSLHSATLGFDPICKMLGSKQKSPNSLEVQSLTSFPFDQLGGHIGRSISTNINSEIVNRCNILSNYAQKLVYREGQLYPNCLISFIQMFKVVMMMTCLFCAPLRFLLVRTILSSPGEGPSKMQVEHGFLQLYGRGTSNLGTVVRTYFLLPAEPGYAETARMLGECGVTLALDAQNLSFKGGFVTASTCLGVNLIERLINSGSLIQIV